MKTAIVLHSYHHHNTEKVALAMAERLSASVLRARDAKAGDLNGYDLIGFGAGIDSGKHYPPLLAFAESLPMANGTHAFLFSTSAISGKKKIARDHAATRKILLSKGYRVVGEFGCVGFNTNSFLKFFGGMNRGRPNAEDLQAAAEFAGSLAKKVMKEGNPT